MSLIYNKEVQRDARSNSVAEDRREWQVFGLGRTRRVSRQAEDGRPSRRRLAMATQTQAGAGKGRGADEKIEIDKDQDAAKRGD
jgi:hypothetical protein